MRRWMRPAVCMIEAVIVLVVVYFEPTHCVRGTLRGEAFFEGRSTSWWRAELAQWNVVESSWGSRETPLRFYYRKPTKWQEISARFGASKAGVTHNLEGPHLLKGDDNVRPILLQLQDDPDPVIRNLVMIGLRRKQ